MSASLPRALRTACPRLPAGEASGAGRQPAILPEGKGCSLNPAKALPGLVPELGPEGPRTKDIASVILQGTQLPGILTHRKVSEQEWFSALPTPNTLSVCLSPGPQHQRGLRDSESDSATLGPRSLDTELRPDPVGSPVQSLGPLATSSSTRKIGRPVCTGCWRASCPSPASCVSL